jgi:hypothetical protein
MRSRLVGMVGTLALAAHQAGAQGVLLKIQPAVGDTLRMRLDQQTEVVAFRQVGTSEAKSTVVSTMQMFSQAIVEGISAKGTTVLAVTDSVLLSTTDERTRRPGQVRRQTTRERVRFHVGADGTVTMSEDDKAPREVSETVSLMPAAFPKEPVTPGESWVREMTLPGGSQFGAPITGKLRVTFRFDSLSHGGDRAYLSMRGEMQPATGLGGSAMASNLEKGVVNGTMLVDRRRGWLTESRFFIAVSSTVPASPATGMSPMRMHVRVTQHMQTVDRR